MVPNSYARLIRKFALLPYFKGKSRLENLFEKLVKLPKIEQGTDFPYGFKMYLNPDSGWEKSYFIRDKELDTTLFLKNVLSQNQVFWDIGANIGFYSLLAAKLVGVKGHVYSFEPTPSTYQRLQKHILDNSLQNQISALQYVLGSKRGQAQLVEPSDINHGMNYFLPATSGQSLHEIESVDHLIENRNLKAPNVIKLDVEGAEFEVLKGAEQTLKKSAPQLVIELCEENLKRFGSSTQELLKFLLGCQPYHISLCFRNKWIEVDPAKPLPHIKLLGDDHGYNYMFTLNRPPWAR